MINSTNPTGIVQPVSLVPYQPIVAAGSGDPIIIPRILAGLERASTNDGGNRRQDNDNSHDGGSHSGTSSHRSMQQRQ